MHGLKWPINLGEAVVDLCEAFAQHAPAAVAVEEEPVAGPDPKGKETDKARTHSVGKYQSCMF